MKTDFVPPKLFVNVFEQFTDLLKRYEKDFDDLDQYVHDNSIETTYAHRYRIVKDRIWNAKFHHHNIQISEYFAGLIEASNLLNELKQKERK